MRIRHNVLILTVVLALAALVPAGAMATGPTYAPAPPPSRAAAPRITVKPPRSTTNQLARFAFAGAGAHECKLDAKAWKRCGAKYQVRVAVGSHKLQVRTAETGAKLASKPTVYSWRVRAAKGKR
jgi:hypothetical protein